MNNHHVKLPSLDNAPAIGIVSPSHCLEGDKIEMVQGGIKKLEQLGFQIKEGKHLWAQDSHGISAGSIEERVSDIHEMLLDESVSGLWFSQGGDTSNELLPYLDFELLKKRPIPLVGLSDITVLLNAFYARTGVITFHGSDPKTGQGSVYLSSDYTIQEFLRILVSGETRSTPEQLPDSRTVVRSGAAEGIFIGGNLQCFRKLFGTPFLPDLAGAILILEGLSTNIEEARTLLAHYKSAGIFNHISGIILGDFYKFDRVGEYDGSGKRVYFEDLLLSATSDRKFPILKTADFGHKQANTFIPIGGKGRMDTTTLEWGISF
jgi:muramoyltetrapeptide carboxypeptidase